ncbi:MAG: alcohol dehydrogenase catalytic domain-containing protein [Actinomycetota bacterium]|nr:alcohol dehydrogenase catalytic domain-containing protein [Actinomycetota bacterium]
MGERAERMSAAVLRGPGELSVEEVPRPEPGAGDVLVEVDLCGICGSDLHMVIEGWGENGSWQGHEWVGTIATVGDGVTRWSPGDQVVGGPGTKCGECAMCKAGRPSLCAGRDTIGVGPEHGAFATYKVTSADDLLPMPAGIEPRAAALAEPLAVALHGINQGNVRPGMRVLVMGAGPIGALSIAALRAMGVDDVTCAEPGESRQALAAAVGATKVVHPDDLTVPSIVEPGSVVEGAVDVVLECSGKAKAMEAGLAQLVRAGTLVLVGAGIQPPRFDPNRILLNELNITGAFTYDADGFERSLELLGSGKLPIDDLLDPEVVPLSGLLEAMHDLVEGRRAGKVLVQP